MADTHLAIGLNARKCPLGQVELRNTLVQAIAATIVDLGAQLLRIGQRMLELHLDAGSRAGLRDER